MGGDTVHHTHMLNTLRAFEMNTSAISGACGTQGGWWQLLGDALEHWACSLAHMLSRDMLGTTCGDEEGTVPPEPQFAKLCMHLAPCCLISTLGHALLCSHAASCRL